MSTKRTYQQYKEMFFGSNHTKPDTGYQVLNLINKHSGKKNIKVGVSSNKSYPDWKSIDTIR